MKQKIELDEDDVYDAIVYWLSKVKKKRLIDLENRFHVEQIIATVEGIEELPEDDYWIK